MQAIFHKGESKLQPQDNSSKESAASTITEIEGKLIVHLSKREFKEDIEKYLIALSGDMKLDDHTKKIFTFEYSFSDNSFIIFPTNDVTIQHILEEFAVVNLIAPIIFMENTTSPEPRK